MGEYFGTGRFVSGDRLSTEYREEVSKNYQGEVSLEYLRRPVKHAGVIFIENWIAEQRNRIARHSEATCDTKMIVHQSHPDAPCSDSISKGSVCAMNRAAKQRGMNGGEFLVTHVI